MTPPQATHQRQRSLQCQAPGSARCRDACQAGGAGCSLPPEALSRPDGTSCSGGSPRPGDGPLTWPSLAQCARSPCCSNLTLLQQVQEAAAVHGAAVAAWVRHAMRQVRIDDFPASWRAGVIGDRSHESSYYHRKYQLRLDKATSAKLEQLVEPFDTSAAEVIRQLIVQASLDDVPESRRRAVKECCLQRRGVQ